MIKSLANSSITNDKKYRSMMAGSVENNADHLIAETVLTSTATSVTFDVSGLAALGYKHLQIRAVYKVGTAEESVLMQFNGDTTSNYRVHRLTGNGTTASSGDFGARTSLVPMAAVGTTAFAYSTSIIDIIDFASTSKNKTFRAFSGRMDNATEVHMYSGVWFSNSAVTSILMPTTTGVISVGSRFSLYASKG